MRVITRKPIKRTVIKRPKPKHFNKAIHLGMHVTVRRKLELLCGKDKSLSEAVREAVDNFIQRGYTTTEDKAGKIDVQFNVRVTDSQYNKIEKKRLELGTSVFNIVNSAILLA